MPHPRRLLDGCFQWFLVKNKWQVGGDQTIKIPEREIVRVLYDSGRYCTNALRGWSTNFRYLLLRQMRLDNNRKLAICWSRVGNNSP